MSDDREPAAARQQPTPYPDVNLEIHDLLTGIRALLGGQFTGMYLVGSLALGNFQPRQSDLDLIIVTGGALSNEIVASLRDLHQRFDHSAAVWSARVDAVYIPQEALREASVTAERYPVLEWPGLLALEPLESGWPIQRYTLREYGIVVSGPDPRSLLDPVHSDDLRQASAAIIDQWRDQAHCDREWIAWLREPANLMFVVLTLCRLLCTLDTGSVASKPVAARWASWTCASQWSELIGYVITEPRDNAVVPQDAVNDAFALLEYTYEQYYQWQASSTT